MTTTGPAASEQQRLEAELRETLERFHQVTDYISEIFYLADIATRKILFISPAYETIFGRSCDSVCLDPLSFFQLVHPDDRERVAHAMPEPPFEPYEFRYRIVKDDGSIRHIFGRGLPVLNAQGECYRVVGLASDITDQVLAAELIAEQQSRVVAAAKKSVLGEMAGSLAHEIHTPLTVIDGMARHLQLMLTGQQAGGIDLHQVSEKLATIQAMTKRSLSVVNGLMEFSRQIDAGAPVAIGLATIVKDTLALCAENFKKLGVDLQTDLPLQGGLEVDGRVSELSQVIMCLLTNALDAVAALPEKWVRLKVTAKGPKLELSVTDT